MPKQTGFWDGLLLCLCCQLGTCAWAQPAATATAPEVVRTQEALSGALASSKATPLDALTAYGKREAIRQMQWRENGLVGFGTAPLIRELNHEQLAAVLRFIDADNYLPMLEKKLVGPPLRLSAPFAQVEQDLQLLRKFADADNTRRAEATAPATEIGAPAVLRRYQELFGARLNPATLTQLITEWNAANPTMPIRVPYSGQEWQAIEVTGIPSFYLLSNGKVVDRRTGWPAEGKAELVKLIDAAAK